MEPRGPLTAGAICWVRLSAQVGERELPARRPAIVVQDAEAGALLPTVIVVPLTAEVQALRYPGTVAVEPDAENGLQRSLVALVFQMTAVDRSLLEPTAGHVSAAKLREIREALEALLGRSSSGPAR